MTDFPQTRFKTYNSSFTRLVDVFSLIIIFLIQDKQFTYKMKIVSVRFYRYV